VIGFLLVFLRDLSVRTEEETPTLPTEERTEEVVLLVAGSIEAIFDTAGTTVSCEEEEELGDDSSD
jgi:hypothetical protein